MAVLIKGMEMPYNCWDCSLLNASSCPCKNYSSALEYTTNRHPDCPLVPVPEPHGDLIDASEKIRVQMYDDEHEDFHMVEMTIDDLLSQSWVKAYAFPVIPASEEGET